MKKKSNNDKKTQFVKEIESLITQGRILSVSMYVELLDEERRKDFKKNNPQETKLLLDFKKKYQEWYSLSLSLVEQVLPSRLQDFIDYFKPQKNRKEITGENYTIYDYLQGISVSKGIRQIVKPEAALPKFDQQLAILESVKTTFESSLHDIKSMAQADLFDSEIEAALELNKNGFFRAAGMIAGVVLEEHLKTICNRHKIKTKKNSPTISDYNHALKDKKIIDLPFWRKIQGLTDIRNLCGHKKERDPNAEDVFELIEGIKKVIKNLY